MESGGRVSSRSSSRSSRTYCTNNNSTGRTGGGLGTEEDDRDGTSELIANLGNLLYYKIRMYMHR